jgi:outer membrane protein OmpA-like peptidoglycan-associated protein
MRADTRSRGASLAALLPLLMGLFISAPAPARAVKPVVAVFDFKAQGLKVHQHTLVILTDYLAAQLAGAGAFAVVPRGVIKRRLAKQKVSSYRRCYDQSCQIEIGRELAAAKSLAPTLIKLGRRCIVTLTLFDLRKATTDRAASAAGGCSEDDFSASVRRAVAKLVGRPLRSKPVAAGQCQPCRAGQRRCVGRGSFMACKPRGGRFLGCNVWSTPRRCPAGQPCRAGRCLAPKAPGPSPPTKAAPPPTETCSKGKEIVVRGKQIYLCPKITFERRTAAILPPSYPILDKLARFLTTTHTSGQLRIESHTNSRGSSAFNLRQSKVRADGVRAYLIGKGVEAGRLTAQGFGEERPIVANTTVEGLRRNSRIELHIVQ